MREIKFRAWNKRDNVMEYNVNINQGKPVKQGYQWVNTENTETVYHSPLQQYTGLKDKNGKEIYEGDIAKSGKRLFVARWNNDIASFVWKPLDSEISHPCFNVGTVKNMEIVGNVYENPELLEDEKRLI